MEYYFVLIFPYSGLDPGTNRWETFERLLTCIEDFQQGSSRSATPLLVVNDDTIQRDQAKYDYFKSSALFLGKNRTPRLEEQVVWAVDTCQMWLDGWRTVCQKAQDSDRIILLPGDIDQVEAEFWRSLNWFFSADGTSSHDFIVGDYETGDRQSTKYLVDWYGTYPQLAVWFPEVAQALLGESLEKPRSEFLNIKRRLLRQLLVGRRKYAYEQTLNMLIQLWDPGRNEWRVRPSVLKLGEITDDPTARNYTGSIDQMERTERMLKRVWRETMYGTFSKDQDFLDQYDVLAARSAAVGENGRLTMLSLSRLPSRGGRVQVPPSVTVRAGDGSGAAGRS